MIVFFCFWGGEGVTTGITHCLCSREHV